LIKVFWKVESNHVCYGHGPILFVMFSPYHSHKSFWTFLISHPICLYTMGYSCGELNICLSSCTLIFFSIWWLLIQISFDHQSCACLQHVHFFLLWWEP
jgi:hypothetical protein